MICCLNPDCPKPQNPDGTNFCLSCGIGLTPLLRSRYRIIEPLGGGGFGRTYLAEDVDKLAERCVVKQFAPQLQGSWSLKKATELFQEEAKRLQQLGEHPQIPTLYAYFEENNYLYLVQQFIEGQNLLQELQDEGVFNEAKIRELLSGLLPVLQAIHQQQVIHRDIKPDNIIRRQSDGKLVLIDFGVAKQATATAIARPGTTIGSFGYAPMEQIQGGEAYPASDLYGLGATCFHLLTEIPPREVWLRQGYSWIAGWRQYLRKPISQELADIFDRLLQENHKQRYQSATLVLQDLNINTQLPLQSNVPFTRVTPPQQLPQHTRELATQKNILLLISLGVIGSLIAVIIRMAGEIISPSPDQPYPQQARVNSGDKEARISLGDKILLVSAQTNPLKQAGVRAFASKDFPTAVTNFQAYWTNNPNDPEGLIYLNNAKIGKSQSLKVAVSLPINGNLNNPNDNVSKELLRGVAQAQDEVNKNGGINGIPLQLEIANDEGNRDIAQQLASEFVQDSSTLAVIGLNWQISEAAKQIYQKHGLVMVNTTTNTSLGVGSSYIFSISPDTRVFADTLARYITQKANVKNIAICADLTASSINETLNTYNRSINLAGGKITRTDCDFKDPNFNSSIIMGKAISDGADGLLLLPALKNLKPAIDIARANNSKLALFTHGGMYTIDTLIQGRENFKGMVLPVLWHPNAMPSNPFRENAVKLWHGPVNARTASSYDALQTIIAGLKQAQTRSGLQETISKPGFSTPGATGKIEFLPSGERIAQPLLVKIEPGPISGVGYDFVWVP
ncbi:MAG: ABC transporter substrate-binding protein [Stigonema ocellatum SAG 48.90 = DSM 106950]|nr:ABC transporter substrate-binding protein [Stigonema ocellatum SAG 48.90 = DSM 106950]